MVSTDIIFTKTMVMIFLLLGFLIFFPMFLLQKYKTTRALRLPPGPRGVPLVGNLHQLDNSALHLHLRQLSQKYGPLMSLRLGSVPTLVVSSAKMAKEVLKTHDLVFSGRPTLVGQQKLSYNGLDLAFVSYGDYWREMRKICSLHLFNSNRVQSFRFVHEEEVSRMVRKISKAADASKPANLTDAAIALTTSIICRVAFGRRYDDEGSQRSRLHTLLSEAQAMLATFFVSDYFPFIGWIDKLTGLIARLEEVFIDLDVFYQEIIDEHLDPNRPEPEQEDIMDVLLRLKKERLFTMDLTWDHIKAVLMNIFIGGSDNSAGLVVWTMTLLMKYPRVMKLVQQEIRNSVAEKEFVNEDDLSRLPYLKAVVKETMRLQPVAPLLVPRETTQHCNVDGYDIPAKTLVFINWWAIGRDPEAWENPEKFCPERFLGSSIDFEGQDYEFIPFGAGRRGCPAMQMGAENVELALANLLYKFDWKMPPGMTAEDLDMEGIHGLTMHKKIPLCLVPMNCCV